MHLTDVTPEMMAGGDAGAAGRGAVVTFSDHISRTTRTSHAVHHARQHLGLQESVLGPRVKAVRNHAVAA